MKTKILSWLVTIAVLCAGCTGQAEKPDLAQQALEDFFDALVNGQYEQAVSLFGGSYETLVEMNPEIPADNFPILWQAACQINGYLCLPIRIITFNETTSGGVYLFSVEFSTMDGELFVQPGVTDPPQFSFEFRVVQGADGRFLVLDYPPYVP